MAYNIVQHRRGTTDEWREHNLIPKEGELVIEECAHGRHRCKIGDGYTRFLDLPYMDEEVKTNVLNTIVETIQPAISTLETKLDTKTEELVSQHSEEFNALAQAIIDESIALEGKINESVDEKVNQLKDADASLLNKIYSVDNILTDITKTLASDLLSLSKRHESDTGALTEKLDVLAEAHDASFESINTALLDYVTSIYAELATLADNDIKILNKAFAVENSLTDKITAVNTSLSDRITVIEDMLDGEGASEIEERLSEKIDTEVASAKTVLLENIETLRSSTNLNFIENKRAVAALTSTVNDNKEQVLDELSSVTATVESNRVDVDATIEAINTRIDANSSRIDDANAELANQAKRISNLIALEPGSTTGDAELADIRSGYNGITHDSAGDAVRAIGNDLEALRNSLPDYIPANAVDGLLYENNQLYLTSNGETVGDPVEITGGGGGGGSVSTVKITNNLASTIFTVAKGNSATIDFTYTSFENEVPTGDGTYSITINNKVIEALSGSVQHGVAKNINVTEYLKTGSNSIKVTCADQFGTSRNLVYTISVIELRIESSFDSTRIFNDEITFRYKIFGQIDKTVHVLVDGEEVLSKTFSANVSGNESTLIISKQAHGSHKITAYIIASIDDNDIYSNILEYEIICTEPNNNIAAIASVCDIKEVTKGDLISIPYMLYDPVRVESTVDLIVYAQVAGELIEIDRTSLTVDRSKQYWKTRNYPTGIAVFTISYTYDLYGTLTTVTKSHKINVKALEIDIAPEEDSLQLYLSSQGRSNNEHNPAIWTFTQAPIGDKTFDEITTTFTNFNWKSNGWCSDDNGDTCLRLNGDARAIINFKPFKDDFKLNGKTIEFEFVVRDVNSRDTVVINCFDGSRGFVATPDTAFLQSSGTKVSCRYKDDERIRVAVSVEYSDSLSRFVSIYLDGILSGVQRYATTDNFAQDKPLNITLGSSLCGLDIYNIRIYDKALSTPQVLTNYIADKAEPATKLQLLTDNDILDENNKISYDRVKALGQLPIITFTGQMPTYKGDKKKKSVRMKFEDPAHPELDFDVLLDQIDVQGTSSQFYVRKNWKVKLPEARPHMPGAIPAKVYCIKVDYAEATGTHNTGTANYVETLYDRNEVVLPPQKDDTRVRTTIQGFPCVLFEKATEDSEPVFSSKGNFNYDKDAENAFGFTEEYDSFGVECWEFCNNTSDAVNFVGEVPADWLEDFEPRYAPESANFERIEELKEIEELAASGKATMTEAQRQELAKLMDDCIANFKEMHDWVLSTATYSLVDGKRIPITATPLVSPITYGETTYTEDCEEYRLAKFKYEFKNYFNMHYCCMYYVFTFFALMTDQRAKNLFLTRWKDDDGVHRWYPYFYDNDTIFGINNEGAMVFDYYHEDTDQLGSSNVYNGQNSAFWNNFRICFPQEIQSTYAALRSDKKLTYDKVIDQYITQGSDKWSAAIYNEDAEYKYISMARQLTESGDVDASNLYQVRGPGEHHLRYFIANRLNYCDSKWYSGEYPDDYIFLRIYTPTTAAIDDTMSEDKKAEVLESNARIEASLGVVPANPNITVTPFSDMYAGVRYKSGTLQQQRLTAGEAYTFRPINPNETFGDTETAIYGASELSSLGDLSGLYCGVISLGKAAKLTELIIGNASPLYHNDNFREISVGSNRLLKTIDLRNCSGLGIAGKTPQKTLELSGCPNIEHIYTEGTNLESVDLPESGYIKTLHLPASINTLVVKNQKNITDFYIESYANIRTLCIEDSELDSDAILAACRLADGKYTVERVRLTGINWSFDNADFVKSLFPRFDEDGNIIGGIRGIDEKNNNLDDAYLVGTCYIDKLSGADYYEIKSHYPYLDIKFGEMPSSVIFMSTDGQTELYREDLIGKNSVTPNCPDPVLTNKISEPTKESNAEFDYEWAGWSRQLDGDIHIDALLNIAGDRVLYPAFKAIRRSYEITFVNATDDNKILQTVTTLYGDDSVYTGPIPTKQDAASPSLYTFTGWHPKPESITGPMTCYAQFTVLDDKWYTIGIADISDCVDYNGNIFDGYTLNISNGTMSITECNNNFNAAVRIPDHLDLDSGSFIITSLGGFAEHTLLELIKLPDSLIEILARGFYNCYGLFELELPNSLKVIGRNAFQGCAKLKEIYIPASVIDIGEAAFADCKQLAKITVDESNTTYSVVQDCLINNNSGTLLQGLSTGVIPQDGSIKALGQYCFSNTRITSICIPDGLTVVANNAFSRCNSLVDVMLPDSIVTLDATCFAWCSNLKEVTLPSSLVNIKTYVFNSCGLEDVTIPASVENILERSFGDMPSLHTVTFKKQLDADGNIKAPYIHKNAFINSGGAEGIVFNVPWSEDYDYEYIETTGVGDSAVSNKIDPTGWGATNYTINYNYKEEE